MVDEIGYLPITRTGAMLFFQLMTRWYEHASTVFTSNKGFEEWGAIFGHDVMATALIDRLLHHCHIVNIRGNSYHMRHDRELWQTLTTPEDDAPTKRRDEVLTPQARPLTSVQFSPPLLCNFKPPLTPGSYREAVRHIW